MQKQQIRNTECQDILGAPHIPPTASTTSRFPQPGMPNSTQPPSPSTHPPSPTTSLRKQFGGEAPVPGQISQSIPGASAADRGRPVGRGGGLQKQRVSQAAQYLPWGTTYPPSQKRGSSYSVGLSQDCEVLVIPSWVGMRSLVVGLWHGVCVSVSCSFVFLLSPSAISGFLLICFTVTLLLFVRCPELLGEVGSLIN